MGTSTELKNDYTYHEDSIGNTRHQCNWW